MYHWHFTDRLFGETIEAAVNGLLDAMAVLPARHIVSLHDVPSPNRTRRSARRVEGYRRLVGAADVAVVASDHERTRLRRGGTTRHVDVIPLPIVESEPIQQRVDRVRRVGVLGFIYPGKGHADVIAAAPALPDDVRLCFLGRAADGHAALLTTLRRAAAREHRRLHISGYLPDDVLRVALQTIDVPVVPARTTSASASVATWIGAGRRPLVARNGYSVEIADRDRHLVTLYEPGQLADAACAALREPSTTFRTCPVPPTLTLPAVAHAHELLYHGIAR